MHCLKSGNTAVHLIKTETLHLEHPNNAQLNAAACCENKDTLKKVVREKNF